MKKSKKLIALLLSGAMCATLAFGAACTGGSDDNDGDTNTNIDNTDDASSGNSSGGGNTSGENNNENNNSENNNENNSSEDTSKGATSAQKAAYVGAIETTLKDALTSTTGYEIVADYDLTENDGSEASAQSADVTLKTLYNATTGFSADLDIDIYSASGTDANYAYMAVRLRDTDDLYTTETYDDSAITSSAKADLYYGKESIDWESNAYADYLNDLFDYAAGTYEAEEGADIDVGAVADLAFDILNSPLCGVYGTISGSTLTFDVLKEVEYIASCVKALTAVVTDTMTISDFTQNAALKAFVELYIGGLTAADIETALNLAANFGFSPVTTLPEVTDGQSAYDYIVAVLNQFLTEEDMSDATLLSITGYETAEELKAYVDDMVDEIAATFEDYTSYVITMTLSGTTLSALGFSYEFATTSDGSTYSQSLSASLTFTEKAITLAAIDSSKVYTDVVQAYYIYETEEDGEDYNRYNAYLMGDGKIVLELSDGAYTATNAAYTLDADGNIASVNGTSEKTERMIQVEYDGYFVYGISFTYDEKDYVLGVMYHYEDSVDRSMTSTSVNYFYYIYTVKTYTPDDYVQVDVLVVMLTIRNMGSYYDTTYNVVGTGVTYSEAYEIENDEIAISDGSTLYIKDGNYSYTAVNGLKYT